MPIEQLIFTNRALGKGVDPKLPGFQIAACSPGLDGEMRAQLSRVCAQFRTLIYECAPVSAKDRERQWRAEKGDQSVFPNEVLNEFPLIWRYIRLKEDLFALLRARYTGFTHDGRLGNLLVHGLVFDPEELAAYGHNPLALARSNLFRSQDNGDETSLPTLADLGAPPDVSTDSGLLAQQPYRDHLEAVISLLSEISPDNPSLLVCLPDWRQATPFVEAALNLLPPTSRCRSTFCTYTAKLAQARADAIDDILISCSDNIPTLGLRTNNYDADPEHGGKAKYLVFNFVEGEFVQSVELGPYAMFTANCLRNGQKDRLESHHLFTERLGLGDGPDAWDALVPIASLSGHGEPQAVRDAIHALGELITRPEQATAALTLVAPQVRDFARTDNTAVLVAIAPELASIVDCAAGESQQAPSGSFVAEIRNLAADALDRGSICTSMALLRACGRARDDGLLSLLKDKLADPARGLPDVENAEDQREMVQLILEGLRLAEQKPDLAPPRGRLMVCALRAASPVGSVAEVWRDIGETVVKPFFDGPLDDEGKKRLLEDIADALSDKGCPSASLWVNMKILKAAPPQGEELFQRLSGLAVIMSRSTEDKGILREVLQIVQDQLPEPRGRVVALGRMSEGTLGTQLGGVLFGKYQEELALVKEDAARNDIRSDLAKAGAVRVLCGEIVDDVLPWQEKDSAEKDSAEKDSAGRFQSWWDTILTEYPAVLDALRSRIGDLLRRGELSDMDICLAKRLLARLPGEQGPRPGLSSLWGAMVLSQPVGPLSAEVEQTFSALPDDIGMEAQNRLAIMRFMTATDAAISRGGWSVSQFKYSDPAWGNVAQLTGADKTRAIRWCVGKFKPTGVADAKDAGIFCSILLKAGEKDVHGIVDAVVVHLLDGRDVVTDVQVVTAFALMAVRESQKSSYWTRFFAALIERIDKRTCGLLEEHLQHRFRSTTVQDDKEMLRICTSAGLSVPALAPPPVQKPQPRSPVPSGGGSAPTPEGRKPGILSRVFGSIFRSDGGREASTSSPRPEVTARSGPAESTGKENLKSGGSKKKKKKKGGNKGKKKGKGR